MKRIFSVLTVVAMTASLSASPAFADRPEQETFDIVGDQYLCGDTLLTAISGQSIVKSHEHELPSGRVRTIFTAHLDNALFEDETGNTFRAVGVFNGNLTVDPDLGEDSEIGHVHANVTLIGEAGGLGDERIRIRTSRDGRFSFVDKGSCEFVGE